MSNPGEHTVKSFDDELELLRSTIVLMGERVEAELIAAVHALGEGSGGDPAAVVRSDREVDDLEHEVERIAVRLLALRQPMAVDLREVVAAIKIAGDLERIGDYAANIAKRAFALASLPQVRSSRALPRMADMVRRSVHHAVAAYRERDGERAHEVWRRDQEVDALYTALFRELLTYMMEDPRAITPSTHLLFVAKNVERMGDHATNIAETVHYMITGQPFAGARPKADLSSYETTSGTPAKEPPDVG